MAECQLPIANCFGEVNMDQATLIQAVVREVLSQLGSGKAVVARSAGSNFGVFKNVNDAVDAAKGAQAALALKGLKVRDAICKMIKRIAIDNADSWARVELEETKVGRLDHKIEKLHWLAGVPGVEFLKTVAHSGDDGIG